MSIRNELIKPGAPLSGKPALYYLLYDEVPPTTCWGCPFRVTTGEEDEDEYYYCDLINKDIWAENPHCTTGDWQVRAREEYLR